MKALQLLLAGMLLLLGMQPAVGQTPADTSTLPVEIPYKKFVLDNGLTLIVSEDYKAPIVAVNIWYHVGSKNEKPGRTGFAHLFEHLMFNGSEHFNDDWFQALERVGATDLNGTTNRDRTNYFQTVPVNALDLVLWLESDRMGHLLGAIDQAKLDEQRGVVQNEKRQGENQPYGKVWNIIAKHTYPEGHPYSWPVIGYMEDLEAATLEDVHEWFKTYYGPNNATIVIAGAIDPQTALEKVKKYFGAIPPGPPLAKPRTWVAKRTGEQRMRMEDRVPQARIYKVWNVPEWGHPERDYLDLAADVLASGKTSRLYRRLVYTDQIATDVRAFVFTGEIGSQFMIIASARPGVPLAQVEQAIDEELTRFLQEGPTADELERVKADFIAGFVRGVERIGGFGGKSDILAQYEVYGGDPGLYKVTLRRMQQATPQQVLEAARKWLSDGVFVLEVHPYPKLQASGEDVDRSQLPPVGPPPEVSFPEVQQATLSNGLKVLLVERHAVPVVNFQLILDAGYAADQFARPGTATLAMNMLDEGTTSRTALEISDELDRLGARLGTGSDLDVSTVYFSTLRDRLDPSLELFADVVLRPAFPEADFQRLKQQQLIAIQREQVSPLQMALRVFPRLLYGEGHAYGLPLTGSGTLESVQQITRDDLVRFHQTWFKPNHATLIVVGAITMDELLPRLERLFADWKPGEVPEKNIQDVPHKEQAVVYLIDRPGSEQSIIFAGHVAPPEANPRELAIKVMNRVLGGAFTSRINMNLREDKGWSYGARTLLMSARGPRPFIVYAPVQTDKTASAMLEIKKELDGIVSGQKPITPEELDKAQRNLTLRLPGRWETANAILNDLSYVVQFGWPLDYWRTYPEAVQALTLDEVNAAAREILHPDRLVWVVVGDRSRIEAEIRQLGLGPVYLIDTEGNLLASLSE
ncbi:M16 family metallopeptidase [Rhodothermus profundi]|uniref:Zinc protease n=1 Tax=Rhodothermus profundi TaxID=633813 RepID=A0A1M6XS28_9BACT|nr:pitrilysin family protein [Rhodothermus profundi]SHL08754.1 zinc protease [Rhodothermus profundi]